MDDIDSAQIDAVAGGFSLIDASISYDDDFLLAASSSEANTVAHQNDVILKEADMGEPSNMLALQRPRKAGKCNLRKSLAWDSAFFTSDGVLDAEELSSILEGAESETDHLSCIQEDLSKSTDSISTFQSESLTLESLEADLFSDIRASIQRSSNSSPAGSTKGDGDSGYGHSMKKAQPSAGSIVKSKPGPKKIAPAGQGPVRSLKSGSISKVMAKPAMRTRESSSSLARPPAVTAQPSLDGVNKRMSVSANRVKSELKSSVNLQGAGKGAPIPKVPRPIDSRNAIQKTLAPAKLSVASSIAHKSTIRSSRSSYDSSCSSSSDNIRKSLPNARSKIEKNANLPSGPKVRTPSRVLVKSNSSTGESQLSAHVKSALKLSPSISPTSSISEWSTESTSSTATVNQNHSGLKYCPSAEDASTDSYVSLTTMKHSDNRSLKGLDNQVVSALSQSAKLPSAAAPTSLVRPATARPSGLRLPSPKIGYFDGAKAGTKTSSGSAKGRSSLPSGTLARPGAGNCSPSGAANKAKLSSAAAKVNTPAARRSGTAKSVPGNSITSPSLTAQLQGNSVGLSNTLSTKNDTGSSCESPITNLVQSAIKADRVLTEAVDGGNHVTDSGSAKKDHLTDLQKADGGDHVTDSGSVEKDYLTDLQKECSANIVDGVADTSVVHLNSNSPNLAGDGNNKVTQETGEKEHADDVGVMAKDFQGVMLKESNAEKVDDAPGPTSELLKFASPNSGYVRNSNVAGQADGGENFCSMFNNNFGVSRKEASNEGIQFTIDNVSDVADGKPTVVGSTDYVKKLCSAPTSMVDLDDCTGNRYIVTGDLSPLEKVNADHGNSLLGSFKESQDSENAVESIENDVFLTTLIERIEHDFVERQLEELNMHEKTRDNKTDAQSVLLNDFQTEDALEDEVINAVPSYQENVSDPIQNDTAQVGPCSLPLPGAGLIAGIRTPFAVKNCVSDVADPSNCSSESPAEACVKIDALPSVERGQKENS